MYKNIALAFSAVLMVSFAVMSFSDKATSRSKTRFKTRGDTSLPTFVTAKDHLGKNITSRSGAVSFTSGLNNDYYCLDSINRTGTLYLEVKLDKFINEKATRVPLNLAIVIDHSGSMAGDKMHHAKESAKTVIDKLTPDDFVSVVIYDQSIEVIQPAVRALDKNSIKQKIDQIAAAGSTNLWGGTEKGYEQVKNNYKEKYVNRVLLISDGLANAGITSQFEIRKRVQSFKDNDGITLSTFGVGLDYNELLMTDMAEAGSGNYYFIDSPVRMASIFSNELNGMLNVVAQNASLKVKLPRGITVTKVFNHKFEQVNDELTIKFRDLFSEDTKSVLMNFAIDDYANTDLRFLSSLNYIDIVDNGQKSLQNENILKPCDEPELYVTHFNKSVMEQIVLYNVNEKLEKAMVDVDRGEFESAKETMSNIQGYMDINKIYMDSSAVLKAAQSVNVDYMRQLNSVQYMTADSVKYMQKGKRAESYKLRNKKN